MYDLDDGKKKPENGTVNYDTLLQLVLFCRQLEKWDEVVCFDLFLNLQNDHESREDCKLPMADANDMFEATKRKRKTKDSCCNGCWKGKECVKTGAE